MVEFRKLEIKNISTMLDKLNYRFGNTVMDALGALIPLNYGKETQIFFSKRMLSKLESSTIKLQGVLREIGNAPPEFARKSLETLSEVEDMVKDLHEFVQQMDDDNKEIKNALIHFINVYKDVLCEMERVSEYSLPAYGAECALAEAWDSVEDNHWDNY